MFNAEVPSRKLYHKKHRKIHKNIDRRDKPYQLATVPLHLNQKCSELNLETINLTITHSMFRIGFLIDMI